MIIFWILAGGLLVLALIFILTPLLKPAALDESPSEDALNLDVFRERLEELDADRASGFLDADQYSAARHDLERELLYDLGPATESGGAEPSKTRAPSVLGRWVLGSLLGVAVPAVAVLAYLQLGDPGIIERLQTQPGMEAETAGADGQSLPSLDVLVKRLEERLAKEPENLEGWLMLGRTYFALDQSDKGLKAVEKAYALAPERTEVKLAYAEALAAASPTRSLDGRPAELIQAALKQDPSDPTARWLSGMVSFQQHQYQEAATVWQQVLNELDPASKEATNLRQMVQEARNRAGMPASAAGATTASQAQPRDATASDTPDSTPAASQAEVSLEVSLDPGMADKTSPDDTVFVFARAAQGPPMPLAVQRLQVKDLPKTLTLDDSMAMAPAMRLSAFKDIVVGARVSKSGNAMPESGDIEGQAGPIQLPAQGPIAIAIDSVRP